MIYLETKLKFVITKEGFKKTVSAFLVIEDEKGNYNSIDIENIKYNELFKYASNYAFDKNINISFRNKKKNNKKLEIITFDSGSEIIDKYNKNSGKSLLSIPNVVLNKKVIKGSILGLTTVLSIGGAVSSIRNDRKTEYINPEVIEREVSNSVINNNDKPIENDIFNNYNDILKEEENQKIIDDNIQPELLNTNVDEAKNVFLFQGIEEKKNEPDSLKNASDFKNLLNRYGTTYGIDPNLLMAIMRQESNGIHETVHDPSEPAYGAMQIEDVWIGESITAYNFDLGEYETIIVEEDKLLDINYNIKVASMLLNHCFRVFDYDIPRSIQAYNMGITKVLNYGDAWNTLRLDSSSGEPYYIEGVFTYLGDGYNVRVLKDDNSMVEYIIDDTTENKYSSENNKSLQ